MYIVGEKINALQIQFKNLNVKSLDKKPVAIKYANSSLK